MIAQLLCLIKTINGSLLFLIMKSQGIESVTHHFFLLLTLKSWGEKSRQLFLMCVRLRMCVFVVTLCTTQNWGLVTIGYYVVAYYTYNEYKKAHPELQYQETTNALTHPNNR